MAAVPVVRLSDLRPEAGVQVRVHFYDYAVWLLRDGSLRVTDNDCQHVGGPLADGAVRDGCVICPWHGWTYDLTTGRRCSAFGDVVGIGTYRCWVEGDQVWVDLPDDRLT